ncbi:DUF2946 domain-containing protein [Paraburkholderia panacisoli]|uniref:DUF2946 domain-containing protein n=1 Tax=Paraburkholderia panacisoli TaxID=2603818 RepID=A0A5B0HAE5_9BURK|nr:DUF2946 domain-containing protein [Paraburkholderia panacisoli]KAA1012030.1 DUF2946 domain-containing protein [Paraburkholderia panacisoli]
MLSRFQRKIGSWLGLFAILMATLAPTISHTLAARAVHDAMSEEHCSMASMDGMSSMPDEAAQTPAAPDDSTGKHAQMSDGDACGYCSLLAHLPAVPSVEALFLVAVWTREHTVAARFESVRRVEPLTFAQPRAPPFAS